MFQIDIPLLLLRNSEPSSYPADSCLLTSSAPFSLPPFFLPLSLDYLFLLTFLLHQSGSSRERWEKEWRFIQIVLCFTYESGCCWSQWKWMAIDGLIFDSSAFLFCWEEEGLKHNKNASQRLIYSCFKWFSFVQFIKKINNCYTK